MGNTERQLIQLIATDRIDKPISSMSGKLKRAKPKLAKAIDLSEFGGSFVGDRAYGRIESEDTMKARGMRDGVEMFKQEYPTHGTILEGMIAEKRLESETHLYFGMHEGRRLTGDDYMGVMTDLGFTPAVAERLYGELMDISYKLARSRDETERSVLIG
ncbi:MAG: hypothetical protein NUV97_04405 [archaeon]|nr:hypothetical protein [archaeon]MCR4323383.1 hypothetical protein [Nanoarchaeota archaeon]